MHYTEEQLNQMKKFNPREYEAYIALKEMEDELSKEFATGQSVHDGEEDKQEEGGQDGVREKGQEEEAEEVKQAYDDVKTDEPKDGVKDIDYWVKEAENWKKRAADSKADLTPTKQENAELKRENSALESKVDALEKKIDELLSRKSSVEQVKETDPEDKEFEDNFPEISRHIKKQEAKILALEAKLAERIKPIEEGSLKAKERFEQETRSAEQARHFAQVAAIHPDAGDFFSEEKNGPAFFAWARSKPSFMNKVLMNPLEHAPADVAHLIGLFKEEVGYGKSPVKPSRGDIALKVHSTPNRSKGEAPGPKLLEEWELRSINRLLAKAASEGPRALAALEERYELTLEHMDKQR